MRENHLSDLREKANGYSLGKKKKKLEIIDSIGPHMIDYTPEVETDGKLESFPIDPKDTNKTLRIGKKS